MVICIIAALTKDRVIGKGGKLPWHISEDLKNFKRLTSGNTVVMGRRTFESIGRPLPNRNNVVLSSSMPPTEGVDVCRTFEAAMQVAKSHGKDVFVIGGARVYRDALPFAEKMYLSWVKGDYEGDTYFPEFDESEWEVERREDRGEFELVVYGRK